jgi:hypothetical protein
MKRSVLGALFGLLLATPALAGPPWISIEYPANPHHESTRGALMLVRAYHHSTGIDAPLSGTLEGIVDGKRVSRRIDITRTNIAGTYAVRAGMPREGTWVVAIHLRNGTEDGAGAVVTLDSRGSIAHVEVPSNRSRDGWTVPRAINRGDVDSALRSARVAAGEESPIGLAGVAGLLGLPLLLLTLRRARRGLAARSSR